MDPRMSAPPANNDIMRRRVLMLALWGALIACKKEKPQRSDPGADGHQVTADANYDAKETIDDSALRFQLQLPGPTWKLLRRSEAQRLDPGAVAGAADDEGRMGVVRVERFNGATLDDAAALFDHDIQEMQTTDVKVGRYDARRSYFRRTGTTAERDVVRVLFLRDGYLFQLWVEGPPDSAREPALQLFIDAFTPTEGELNGSVLARPVVTDALGPGWRIRDRSFESGRSGLRITPTQDWEFVVGAELRGNLPDAELLLTHGPLGANIGVLSEPMLGRKREPTFAAAWARLEAVWGPSTPVTREGSGLAELRTFTAGNLEYEAELSVHEGVFVTRIAWYSATHSAQARAAVTRMLEAFEFMPAKARRTLLDELEAEQAKHPPVQVMGSLNQLGRVVNDFERRIRWTAPNRLFDVLLGPQAAARVPGAQISVIDPRTMAAMDISVVAGGAATLDSNHATLASGGDGPDPLVVDGVDAVESRGISDGDGQLISHRIISFARGDDSVHIHLRARGSGKKTQARMQTFLDGLSLPEALPQAGAEGDRFINHLFGYTLQRPEGWTEPELEFPEPNTHQLTWAKDLATVALISMPMGATTSDGKWVSRFVEQALRDEFAKRGGTGEPNFDTVLVDGVEWRQMAFEKIIVTAIAHHNGLHFLLAENTTEEEVKTFLGGLAWTTTEPGR